MIYDTDGLPIYSAALALGPNEVKTASVDIDCLANYVLKGTAVSGVTVEAKHSAAGSWTNIETSTIALAAWAGTTQRFLVRFTTSSVGSFSRPSFTLSVEHSA